ncbi:chorismate mutase [Phaffia rhodozyma]|uniref:Chorismate mutase n=1 Tax=Phaffia rhodozyma TaxID=264483 RepID=A0A0F7SJZ4_PHARH|nr:chorismate mutase [Phaffia rhodozyma]
MYYRPMDDVVSSTKPVADDGERERTGESLETRCTGTQIRHTLNRLEDTIIFHLIERAQFAYNPITYTPDAFKELKGRDFQGSWLEWFLKEIETFHAKARRYTSPDEHPFTSIADLPMPMLSPQDLPKLLYKHNVNVNQKIKSIYIEHIVPAITRTLGMEDDGNYGSSATRDVEVLQAISRRVHFGMFVSESKFLLAPHDFIPHILDPNPTELLNLITKPAVEAALLIRVRNKAKLYGQDLDGMGKPIEGQDQAPGKLDPAIVVRLYEEFVMPLTKVVEVEYLLTRLDGVPQSQIEAWQNKTA